METSPPQLELAEYDDAGNTTATYVETGPRIDVILPDQRKSLLLRLLDVFLPAGYPTSVTEDYLPCVIFLLNNTCSDCATNFPIE
ncbi:hypothetical protein SLS55_001955 [Diplodia seriata]|uniref:Protein root UVB sensitive/RUS domain-containing protein n=1 Tax=Diplodia seriata TaxID=420778 RepID=A0A0G2GVX8_9PEZI|nr:hypothetical protein UCDDS831_g00790 [Diplodia seriata]